MRITNHIVKSLVKFNFHYTNQFLKNRKILLPIVSFRFIWTFFFFTEYYQKQSV